MQEELAILIPYYNNLKGLVRSLRSIIYGAKPFVIIVVDDGSLVPVKASELLPHLNFNGTMKVLRLNQNRGITQALNYGLEFIYSCYDVRFIARLDCGDICSEDRFYKQVKFLELSPSVQLLGTWCYFKHPENEACYRYTTPTSYPDILSSMHFRNVFIHPTVMWRNQADLTYLYPEKYPHAEDYGLFYDIISKKEAAILPEFLVTCEINKNGISLKNRQEQLRSRLKVIKDFGKNKWRVAFGALKIYLLEVLPYGLVAMIKNIFIYTTLKKRGHEDCTCN